MDSQKDRDDEYRKRIRAGEEPRYHSRYYSHLKALIDTQHPFASVFVDKRIIGLASSADENEHELEPSHEASHDGLPARQSP